MTTPQTTKTQWTVHLQTSPWYREIGFGETFEAALADARRGGVKKCSSFTVFVNDRYLCDGRFSSWTHLRNCVAPFFGRILYGVTG